MLLTNPKNAPHPSPLPASGEREMLKSRIDWRAGLGKMARAVVDCAGVGVCISDYGQLKFEKVRRPIYPLDLPNR